MASETAICPRVFRIDTDYRQEKYPPFLNMEMKIETFCEADSS